MSGAGAMSAETVPASKGDDRGWRRADWLACIVVAGLLTGHFLLGLATARSLSVTHDEYWHLPVGILNLCTVRFDYEPLNPPLTRIVSAAATTAIEPASFQGAVPVSSDSTKYGLAFLRQMGQRHQPMFVVGRAANLMFSIVTGVLLAVWSWQWWGRVPAVLAVLLWCTEPTVLAHASLVTPDAGLTCLTCAVWYALWSYFQRSTFRRIFVCGVLLGLAQLTKFTAIILVPLVCVVWTAWWLWRRRLADQSSAIRSPKMLGHPVLLCCVCLFVINAGYVFEGTFSTLNQVQPASRTVRSWLERLPILGQVPLPFPKSFLIGLDAQKHVMESRHPVYLDGVWSETGFRFYFLWALWYKLPHTWQVLCLLALARLALRKSAGEMRQQLLFVGIPLCVLLGTASLSGMQLGVRYVLPIYPFLCLLASLGFVSLKQNSGDAAGLSRWQTRILMVACILCPLTLRHHPQHLAYFNELASGPAHGAEHLLDSNLDWGQDLLALSTYLKKNPDRHWGVAYFGSVPPGELGLHYDIPPGRGPVPGSYAVSINYVYGRPHVLFDDRGQPRAAGLEEFGYFRAFEPDRKIGGSILIYHIRPTDVLKWQAR